MRDIRFCVIGTGRAGLIHAGNLARRVPGARLVAVCDADEQSVAAAAAELGVSRAYRDYRQSIDDADVQAVVITTPTFLHREVACAAARAGKHIFLEKPMAVTVEECRAINAAVKEAGVKLQMGFMRRFDAGFRQARELIDSGALGRVMIIKSTGRGPGGPGPWMYDLRKSNGIVAEVNSHDIDSLFWFTGQELRRVYATGRNFKCDEARAQWPDFYDNVVAHLTYDGDAMGVIDGTCPAHYGYDARVEILCEKGVLFVGDYRDPATATRVTLNGEVIGQAVKTWRTLFKDAYVAELQHFVECIAGDRAPEVTGRDGLRAVATVLAINQSIRSGAIVDAAGKGFE